MKLKGHRSDTIVYLIWSLLKEKRNRSEHSELAERVSSLLSQVPHEDRHSPQYFFIKGMYYEIQGEVQKAYTNLKHSLALDPQFADAGREVAFIKRHYAGGSKSFSDDLSQVMTKLFGKKSG